MLNWLRNRKRAKVVNRAPITTLFPLNLQYFSEEPPATPPTKDESEDTPQWAKTLMSKLESLTTPPKEPQIKDVPEVKVVEEPEDDNKTKVTKVPAPPKVVKEQEEPQAKKSGLFNWLW
ncbi:hypothetical protein E8L90_29720 [Brevibacillus antibioticus]|uniref:Uncharacterized protein n=1 Tax=Brevibacillus antibioticus TaxID=2570228 RepID=A0A4U2XYF2_9BACL|nr:hypothetical protein [Brevibacillus antibioticus]TKI52936.1 hypothetical protein E8L90_29720 [Brevibacillus antibioticus]